MNINVMPLFICEKIVHVVSSNREDFLRMWSEYLDTGV